MDGFERVNFDFSTDGGFAAVKQLEDILRSGHWSDSPLDYNDERTMLLLRLIRTGDIKVYKREYIQVTETPELWRRAEELNLFIRKRYEGGILLDIANIFSGYEYDRSKTEFNSLFFPELKAYVRCGGLPPYRLFGLLEREGCEAVFLFPGDYYPYDESVYFAFTIAVPKELFLEELEKTNGRILEMMHEIANRIMEEDDSIIPSIDTWPKDK